MGLFGHPWRFVFGPHTLRDVDRSGPVWREEGRDLVNEELGDHGVGNITKDVRPVDENCGGEESLLGERLNLSLRATETNK